MCRFKYAFHCPHVTLINTLDITDILKASPMNSIFLKYFESKWQASTSFLGADGSWSAMMFVNVFSPYGVESVNVSLVMIHFKSDIKSSMCLKIKRTIKCSCWLVQLTAKYVTQQMNNKACFIALNCTISEDKKPKWHSQQVHVAVNRILLPAALVDCPLYPTHALLTWALKYHF